MSILQEYEEINEMIGNGRVNAIEDYIKYCKDKNNKDILYSDIVYKEKEYKLFDKWFNKQIKPFDVDHFDDDCPYSVTLYQNDYWYDWVEEKKIKQNKYGDGHCYNDAFNYYLGSNKPDLNNRLQYDSENGMFCVYCRNMQDAEEVAYELSKLYKNEEKMIELIKQIKQVYGYEFEIDIRI